MWCVRFMGIMICDHCALFSSPQREFELLLRVPQHNHIFGWSICCIGNIWFCGFSFILNTGKSMIGWNHTRQGSQWNKKLAILFHSIPHELLVQWIVSLNDSNVNKISSTLRRNGAVWNAHKYSHIRYDSIWRPWPIGGHQRNSNCTELARLTLPVLPSISINILSSHMCQTHHNRDTLVYFYVGS